MKGALIYAENWELNVMHLANRDTLKAVVKMNSIRVVGNEGESTIGDPRDFNSYRDVTEALTDHSRQA
jgi:hypothetical protein